MNIFGSTMRTKEKEKRAFDREDEMRHDDENEDDDDDENVRTGGSWSTGIRPFKTQKYIEKIELNIERESARRWVWRSLCQIRRVDRKCHRLHHHPDSHRHHTSQVKTDVHMHVEQPHLTKKMERPASREMTASPPPCVQCATLP